MKARLVISEEERRRRLADRHLLAAERSPDPLTITRSVVALHSTDPASVYLSAAARGCLAGSVEAALYEQRSLVRMLGMRRTMFVVTAELAPVVHGAATRAIAARERTRLVGFLEAAGVATDGDRFLSGLEDATMAALDECGEAFGNQLGDVVPGLRRQIPVAGGTQSLTTRVLFVLAAEGRIVRGRPKGSWLSSQYRWTPASQPPPGEDELPTRDAQVELAKAYLRGYGPATAADLRWWTGWTAKETRQALAGLDTDDVELENASAAFVLAGDTGHTGCRDSLRLLPALDPSVMGWTGRDFYLDPTHRDPAAAASLFDRSGNPGPTIWWGGRIVGGWAQRKDGEIVLRILADLGSGVRAQVEREKESEAARAAEFLGDVRVTPRFRTPLERELSG